MATLERRTFKSFNSKHKSGESRRNNLGNVQDQIVNKGGNDLLKIDIKRVESILKSLREQSDTPIMSLKGADHDQFKQMVTYVFLLYDTPSYKVLYDLIGKYFNDVGNVKPGTIGAYFGGCRVNTDFSGSDYSNGCSVICAGSVPNPEESLCENLVIWAVYKNDSFNFVMLNKSTSSDSDGGINKNEVFIFTNHTSIDSFPGFTDKEKDKLIKMGIEKVKLFGYEKDGKTYKHIGKGEFIPLEDVKSRLQVVASSYMSSDSSANSDSEGGSLSSDLETTSDGISDGTSDDAKEQSEEKSSRFSWKNRSNTALYAILLVILITLILFFAWKSRR